MTTEQTNEEPANHAERFIEQTTYRSAFIARGDLYDQYQRWRHRHGLAGVTRQAFYAELRLASLDDVLITELARKGVRGFRIEAIEAEGQEGDD